MRALHRNVVVVLAAASLFGCNRVEEQEPLTADDVAAVAALQQGEDGSDPDFNDSSGEESVLDSDCSFGAVRQRVIDEHDDNGDGVLSRQERLALGQDFEGPLRRIARPHLMLRHRVAYLHWLYDEDRSDRLDASERESLVADLETRCENRKAQLLTAFDANQDGELNDAEWQAARVDLAARFAARRVAFVQEHDADQNGRLEIEERYNARMELRDAMEQRLESLQDEYDADDSGTLDDAEAQALREHLQSRVRGEHFVTL